MPDAKSSEITSRPPLADLAGERGTPPGIVYIGRDDRLYVRSGSMSSQPAFQLSGRLLHADGSIRPFSFSVVPGANVFADRVLNLAEGFLLSVAAHGGTNITTFGQVFTEVGILRGRLADLQIGQVLFRGYLAPGVTLGWPPGRIGSTLEEPGRQAMGSGNDPAAGAEASFTVVTDTATRFVTFRVALTTDATVADRQVRLELVNAGGVVVWRSEPFAAHAASTTRTYNWAAGGEFRAAVDNGEHHGYIPAALLLEGQIVRTATVNLQAGDDFAAPAFLRFEWFQP